MPLYFGLDEIDSWAHRKKKIKLQPILKKKENCNDQEIFPILGVAINVLILKFG